MTNYKKEIWPTSTPPPKPEPPPSRFTASATPDDYNTISMSPDFTEVTTIRNLEEMGYSFLSILNRLRNPGDRLKSYMVIATRDWDSIKNNKSLNPQLLRSDFPDFIKVGYKRLGGQMVKFYIYQETSRNRWESIFKSEIHQKVDFVLY